MSEKTVSPGSVPASEPGGTGLALPMEAIVGPPLLLTGESESAYRALFWEVRGSVAPKDAIEELWVHDVVELCWENLRLRRLKVKRMNMFAEREAQAALAELASSEPRHSPVCSRIGRQPSGNDLAGKWARGEPAAAKHGGSLLAKAGINDDEVMTHTLSTKLKEMDRIDQMIMQTELRRSSILRELDRRRDAAWRRRRLPIEDVTDIEIDASPTRDRNPTP